MKQFYDKHKGLIDKLFFIAIISAIFLIPLPAEKPQKDLSIEVNFSPNGGVMEAIVREINASKKSIFISAYSFTNPSVGEALSAAHSRGVKVECVLDRENLGNPSSLMLPLYRQGIAIYLDDKHQISHNKIMIIDGEVVLTGSCNFTKACNDSNAENSLIIKNNQLAQRYMLNYELHKSHSSEFQAEWDLYLLSSE